MNILMALHREERKLLAVQGKIEGKLTRLRAAINALADSSNGAGRKGRRRGYKMSAAHKRAIRLGIRRAQRAKAEK
jgi:hypothetical protein